MTYRVTWEIDIEADSPRQAAEIADGFRRLSTIPCFAVTDRAGNVTEVDLDNRAGEDMERRCLRLSQFQS
jgi:hypothetical protein